MATKRIVRIAVSTALIIAGGLISIPVPFTDVEVSLQVLFVLLAGLLLGPVDGALAVLVYIVMGLIGIPVFTKGGGIGYVVQPSFGYLIGFPAGAALTGIVMQRLKKRTAGRAFIAVLIGMVPIYIMGISYQVMILHFYMGSTVAAAFATVPAVCVMLVKDAAICGLACTLYPALYRALRTGSKKTDAAQKEKK